MNMEITATQQAIDILRGSGGPLFVWPTMSSGCQSMAFLQTATEQPRAHRFRRVPFPACHLYLSTTGPWPEKLTLSTRHGRVCALWNDAAWRI